MNFTLQITNYAAPSSSELEGRGQSVTNDLQSTHSQGQYQEQVRTKAMHNIYTMYAFPTMRKRAPCQAFYNSLSAMIHQKCQTDEEDAKLSWKTDENIYGKHR